MLLIEAFAPADPAPASPVTASPAPAGSAAVADPATTLVLPFDARTRSRLRTQLASGEEVGLFLPRGTLLQDGDRLLAADGRVIVVQAAAEALAEVRSADPLALTRAAYHLGNRHVAVEVGAGYLRFARDSVLEGMVAQMGLQVVPVTAGFRPEAGAYGSAHTHGAEQLPGTPRIHDHFAG